MAAPVPNYTHKAEFLQGHDGDSFWLSVDFGVNMHGVKFALPFYIRLYGIDTWEIPPKPEDPRDPGWKKGYAARDATNVLLDSGEQIVVNTLKPKGTPVGEDYYGRFLCRVFVGDADLADLLRSGGHEKQ